LNKPNAIFWPFRYSVHTTSEHLGNLDYSWEPRFMWVAQALLSEGFEVLQHKDFICNLGEGVNAYEPPFEKKADVIIYNHCESSEIEGRILDSKRTWFFKPTVPDAHQTTLDDLGYGSYSSITYEKPDFELSEKEKVDYFFETRVSEWIKSNGTKWGTQYAPKEIEANDYILVLGQCGGDAVLTRQDFGSYFQKLDLIVRNILRSSDRDIIVKLHPWMNGRDWKEGDADHKAETVKDLENLSERVKVFGDFSSIHSFAEKCHCAFVGNSGAGFEVMMHNKPLISFCQPEYHWVTYDLRKSCDVRMSLQINDWFDEELSRKFLYWYMEEYCFYDQKTARLQVKRLLQKPPKKYPWHIKK